MYRTVFWNFLLCALILVPFQALPADQFIHPTMARVYAAFRELTTVMAIPAEFQDPGKKDRIVELIDQLTSHFEGLERHEHRYEFEAGFEAKLLTIKGTFERGAREIAQGHVQAARETLRGVSRQCFSCHSVYGVDVSFSEKVPPALLKNNEQLAEYALATRQYDVARKAFLEAARSANDQHKRIGLLKAWLVLETRTSERPGRALEVVEEFLNERRLSTFEKETLRSWHQSLIRWTAKPPAFVPRLRLAENLLRQGLGSGDPLARDFQAVEVLRSTAILHQILDSAREKPFERRRALYLLGLAYSQLDWYELGEAPELYLEQGILEFKGTADAKRSFDLYRTLVTKADLAAFGSLQQETLERLKMLEQLAFQGETV